MGIPLTIFTLYALDGDACVHHLLLRLRQPAFSNADAADYDRAVLVVEQWRQAFLRVYQRRILLRTCAAVHEVRLIGELQARPVGDELSEGVGGGEVDLWTAQTKHGAPWLVMGTAESEAAFWRGVDEDDDLAALGPIRPGVPRRAFFLAEREYDASDF
jgi:hypothetical protein